MSRWVIVAGLKLIVVPVDSAWTDNTLLQSCGDVGRRIVARGKRASGRGAWGVMFSIVTNHRRPGWRRNALA